MMITPLHTVFYLMKIPTVVLSKIKVKKIFLFMSGRAWQPAWARYAHGTLCWWDLATANLGTRIGGSPGRRSSQSCTQMALNMNYRQVKPEQAQEHGQGGAQAEEVLNPAHRWR